MPCTLFPRLGQAVRPTGTFSILYFHTIPAMINTMKSLLALCLFYSAASVSTAETPIKHTSFRPGEIWTDNNGAHINAHGGGILYDKGTYYWYGEHKVEGDAGNYAQVGVHCYSSKDLYN